MANVYGYTGGHTDIEAAQGTDDIKHLDGFRIAIDDTFAHFAVSLAATGEILEERVTPTAAECGGLSSILADFMWWEGAPIQFGFGGLTEAGACHAPAAVGRA